MKLQWNAQKWSGVAAALLVLALGSLLLLVPSPVGNFFIQASYDWALTWSPAIEGLTGDRLHRLPLLVEIGVLLLTSIGVGLGVARFRPLVATGLACVGVVAVLGVSFVLAGILRLWFPWLIVAVVPLPPVLLCRFVFEWTGRRARQREAEQEHLRAHLRLKELAAMLDQAEDAIWAMDKDGFGTYWNASAEKLFGWTASEILFHDLKKHLFASDNTKAEQASESVVKTGHWSGELRQKTKIGTPLVVQSRWSLVRDSVGIPKYIFAINTDLTSQKDLEGEFARTQRLESIGTLAVGIAHDLNNALSPIIMGVDLLQSRVQDEQCLRMLQAISASARRGADTVKQVLAFASGQPEERKVSQLSHLIREVFKLTQDTFPKSIEIKTRIENGLWPVLGDPAQLHQLIHNLCLHARDAMPGGGQLVIEAKNVKLTEAEAKQLLGAKPIEYVLLSVTDTCVGISRETIDRILEPFVTIKAKGRGPTAARSAAISIGKGQWGAVDIQSELGKGTTFSVYLPAAQNGAPALVSAPNREKSEGGNELILLVDDEVWITEVAASVLRKYGFRVLTAANGKEAVALYSAQRETVALAVVDMMMPVMDGPATVHALRELQPDLRCLVITGMQDGEETAAKFGKDPVTFLIKPFTIEQLTETVQKTLAHPPTGIAREIPAARPAALLPV